MFEAGAREVHLRVSSPPIAHPDFYGIDTPRPSELLAANMTVEEMCAFVGATSLAFLSVDGIYRALGYERRDPHNPQFTDHCFTGDYPTTLRDQNGATHTGQLSFLSEVR
jgi:amidophosphoribosyltransferase